MPKSPEAGGSPESKENDQYQYKIEGHFRRHGAKTGGNEVEQSEDLVMLLTYEGEGQAIAAGEKANVENVSTVSGSPRDRALQTAVSMAAWNNPDAPVGAPTIDELLDAKTPTGASYREIAFKDERLDMTFVKPSEAHERLMKAYDEKRYLDELIVMDAEAKAAGHPESSVYAMQARNIASLIEQDARIATATARKQREEGKEWRKTGEAEILGSHGGVGESFLMEIVRRTKGEEELHKFADFYESGFKNTEGFDFTVIGSSTGKSPKLRIRFESARDGKTYSFDEAVHIGVLDQIMKDFAPKPEEA